MLQWKRSTSAQKTYKYDISNITATTAAAAPLTDERNSILQNRVDYSHGFLFGVSRERPTVTNRNPHKFDPGPKLPSIIVMMAESKPYDNVQLDWIQLSADLDPSKNESFLSKWQRKFAENPFVPIGKCAEIALGKSALGKYAR